MPALSPTMMSGTVSAWVKNVGDELNPGDTLASIETDKARLQELAPLPLSCANPSPLFVQATVDFVCQDAGFLAKQLIPAGTPDVAVGDVIAIRVADLADVAAFASAPSADFGAAAAPAAAAPAPAAAAPSAAAAPAPAAAPPAAAPAAAVAPGGRVVASPLAKKVSAQPCCDTRHANTRLRRRTLTTYPPSLSIAACE